LATQQFWERLKKKFGELSEEESAGFDAIRKGAKSGQVYRDCSYFDNGKIGIFIATSNFVKFEISLGLPKENYKLATYLESCISEISNHIDYVATIVPVEDKVSQELRIAVKSSTDIPNRGPITKHKTEVQDLYIDQAFEVVPKLNNILKKKIEQYSALNESIPAPADSSVNVPLYESSKENLENNNSPINSDTSGESGSSDSGDKINVNS